MTCWWKKRFMQLQCGPLFLISVHTDIQLCEYSRVSNGWDSPLINYSVFWQTTPTLFSTPRLLILENLSASSFIPNSPFTNSCAQSTAVAWSVGKATKLLLYMLFFPHRRNEFHIALITVKHDVAWRGEPSKRTSDSSCRWSTFVFLMFCWYFHKIVWWFYFNEICDCCVFASLLVYTNFPVY